MGNQKGLTLIEVILATGILVLVVISAYTTYKSGLWTWERKEERIDALYGASLAIELITNDLRSTFLPPTIDPNEPPKITFIGKPMEIELITASENPLYLEDRSSDLVRVKYSFEDGRLKMVKDGKGVILTSSIKGISFSYHNGLIFQDFWDSNEVLPKAVRIEMELDDGRVLSTLVWIPTS